MDRFLTCLCDEDYTALIIDGQATKKELEEAWIVILADYYETRGDSMNSVKEWKLGKDIRRLNNHLYLLDKCIEFLKVRYSEAIADSVRQLGYPFNPKSTDPLEYLNDLQVIVNKSKTKYVQLQQAIEQLKKITDALSDKLPKREDFESMLIQIEEMQKVSYSFEQLTVSKFLILEKKLTKRIEQMEAKRK